jgi:hypothetical protein
MRKRFVLPILTLLLLTGCAARQADAQFLGYTSPQTTQQNALVAVTTPTTFNVTNVGQNIHFLSYTKTGTILTLDLRLEGSNDGVNFFPISDDALDILTTSGVLYAVGYYPVVRVNLVGISGGGSVTASYTGTSGSSSPPTGNTYTTGLQVRKVVFTNAAMNANQLATILAPFNSSSGFLFLISNGGSFPTGSTVAVSTVIANSGIATVLPSTSLTTTTSLLVPVTSGPATSVSISYISGGASANTFSGYYIFSPANAFVDPCQSPATAKSSVPINITTAATTQLVALQTFQTIYVCGVTMTIAPSGTTADTITFEYGTSGSCAGGTTALTGALGAGDLTTTTGVVPISFADPGTSFKTPPSNAVCALTAGTTVNIQGFMTYVQQ